MGPLGYDFDYKGPYRVNYNDAGLATTGKALYTPSVGERIIGMWVEVVTAFSVADEQIGVGVAATADADLAFKTDVDAAPAATPTFVRTKGASAGFGTEVVTILAEAPLVAKAVTGGSVSGAVDLYFVVLPA